MSRIEARSTTTPVAPSTFQTPQAEGRPSAAQVREQAEAQTERMQPRSRVRSSRPRRLPVSTDVPEATRPGEFVIVSRTFLPHEAVGGFHGDDRGFTTSADVTARSRVGVLFESNERGLQATSSGGHCDETSTIAPALTTLAGHIAAPGSGIGGSATATPDVQATGRTRNGMAIVQLDVAAANPSAPSPDVDFHAGYAAAEVDGNLRITARVHGDEFPALESFVRDHAGNAVFLGTRSLTSEDGLTNMVGDDRHEMMRVDVTILRDPDTQEFTGVRSEGRDYSIDEWNAQFENAAALEE